MEITKVIEFDMGHRIPSHASKCRNAHGHRYRMECTFSGDVLPARGASDDGMVVDFGDMKRIMTEEVHDKFDHAFVVYMGDIELVRALRSLGDDHATIEVNFIPTAENLATFFYTLVDTRCREFYDGRVFLSKLRLFETPNSWADATEKQEEMSAIFKKSS